MEAKEIVKEYLERSGLSQRGFAEAISQAFKEPVSHATVNYWLIGKTVPSTDLCILIGVSYSDWRRELALDLLKLKLPEVESWAGLFDPPCGDNGRARKLDDDVWQQLVEIIRRKEGNEG